MASNAKQLAVYASSTRPDIFLRRQTTHRLRYDRKRAVLASLVNTFNTGAHFLLAADSQRPSPTLNPKTCLRACTHNSSRLPREHQPLGWRRSRYIIETACPPSTLHSDLRLASPSSPPNSCSDPPSPLPALPFSAISVTKRPLAHQWRGGGGGSILEHRRRRFDVLFSERQELLGLFERRRIASAAAAAAVVPAAAATLQPL